MAAAAHTAASQFAVAVLQSEDIDTLCEGHFADQTRAWPKKTYISVQLTINIIFYVDIAFFKQEDKCSKDSTGRSH